MNDQELHGRVLGLERENRRMKRALLGLVAVVVAAPLLAFAHQSQSKDAHYRVVYASKFALKDPRTGTVLAQLAHETKEGGWAGITLWDEDGQPRAEFKLWDDGRAHLLMMDAERRELSRLSVGADGEPELVLGGRTVQPR